MQTKLTATLLSAFFIILMVSCCRSKVPSYPAAATPTSSQTCNEKATFDLAPTQTEREFVMDQAKRARQHKEAQEEKKAHHLVNKPS